MKDKLQKIFSSIQLNNDDLLPSQWAELKRTLTSDVSTLQGKFNYNYTPYLREVVDTLSPYNPAKVIGVMKAAQIGFTEGVIVNGILWIIANNPGNILSLSANDQLSKEMVETRLDQGITSCGIGHLIRPNTIRKRNNRTGDTSNYKEFAGGRMYAGGLQSMDKLGKQRSIKYGFFDDWDAAKVSDKEQGNIFDIIQQRFSTAAKTGKQYYISTPENRPSNVEIVYNMGDQRKWNVPCPKCGSYIELIWLQYNKENEPVGIIFEKDSGGRLIESSVRYRCQSCGGEFKETEKYEINLHGKWIPTVEPIRTGYYSYHIPAWAASPHMYGWTHYAHQWCNIFKDGQESKSKLRVFKNLVMGEPYEDKKMDISSNILLKNTRPYDVGVVPCLLSEKDGNGSIVMITAACDLNGTIDDARMDYEVVAHSSSGTTYSIDAGSIGTYQAKLEKSKRELWTYRNEQFNNVWDEFLNNVILKEYQTDDGKIMKVTYAGIDTGYYTHFAYGFVDAHPELLIGLKGRVDDKPRKYTTDLPTFKMARERANLYILEVDLIKDELADRINLRWSESSESEQPSGFMNFPTPSGEKYRHATFFSHYEAEQKVLDRNDDGDIVGWKWKKKHQLSQNHFFDCAVYNIAVRDIFAKKICKEAGIKYGSWAEYVGIIKKILG
jgi:phage terminase large subunit GpA-like protein